MRGLASLQSVGEILPRVEAEHQSAGRGRRAGRRRRRRRRARRSKRAAWGLGPGPHPAGQGSLQGDAVACPAGDVELASTSLRPAPMTARDLGDAARRRGRGALASC